MAVFGISVTEHSSSAIGESVLVTGSVRLLSGTVHYQPLKIKENYVLSSKPPVQWVPGALSPRIKQLGREADYYLHLAQRLRTRGATPPLLRTSS
jgi:hypothetical protein